MYVFVGLQAAARRPVLHPSAPMLHSPRQLQRREETRREVKWYQRQRNDAFHVTQLLPPGMESLGGPALACASVEAALAGQRVVAARPHLALAGGGLGGVGLGRHLPFHRACR